MKNGINDRGLSPCLTVMFIPFQTSNEIVPMTILKIPNCTYGTNLARPSTPALANNRNLAECHSARHRTRSC